MTLFKTILCGLNGQKKTGRACVCSIQYAAAAGQIVCSEPQRPASPACGSGIHQAFGVSVFTTGFAAGFSSAVLTAAAAGFAAGFAAGAAAGLAAVLTAGFFTGVLRAAAGFLAAGSA